MKNHFLSFWNSFDQRQMDRGFLVLSYLNLLKKQNTKILSEHKFSHSIFTALNKKLKSFQVGVPVILSVGPILQRWIKYPVLSFLTWTVWNNLKDHQQFFLTWFPFYLLQILIPPRDNSIKSLRPQNRRCNRRRFLQFQTHKYLSRTSVQVRRLLRNQVQKHRFLPTLQYIKDIQGTRKGRGRATHNPIKVLLYYLPKKKGKRGTDLTWRGEINFDKRSSGKVSAS